MSEFENMTSTDESNYEYDFEDFETFEWPGEDDATATVVGELLAVQKDIGRYDSRVYLLDTEEGKVMVWGNGSIDSAFDKGDIETGDMVGFRKDGETYENKFGEFASFEVRYTKA